jgi:hypothetical protein
MAYVILWIMIFMFVPVPWNWIMFFLTIFF